MNRLISKIILTAFFLFFTMPVFAQEYKAEYAVDYFIQQNQGGLSTKVNFAIKTTNLRSDVFVKKFTLRFPKTFSITNLQAKDDNGSIKPSIIQDEKAHIIELEYTDPKIGKESENNFYLEFNQANLFEVNGSIWEVILPTIENRGEGAYKVQVHLPDSQRKISIAKPRPDLIQGGVITWNNPKERTIYAVFGDKQKYEVDLRYNLQNVRLTETTQEIALPPDTAHQKLLVLNLEPRPKQVYIDDDGNYIARYTLGPKEQIAVQFKGIAEISPVIREEVRAYQNNKIALQERYLLSESKFWNINNPEQFLSLKTPADLYNFLVEKFSYDYNRVLSSSSYDRFGAEKALQNPNKAVCVEFTDTFIALAREKGTLSREIQGYAVTQDSRLRPLSLLKDVLHSWPEYYNKDSQSWIQIDPTWGNTSGIDYFSSFDLNHIAFAIHGKKSDYPYPAGFYKTGNTRDINVKAIESAESERKDLQVKNIETDKRINDSATRKGYVVINNGGNSFRYDIPVLLQGENVDIDQTRLSMDVVAPFEEKKIEFSYRSKIKNRNGSGSLTVNVNNGEGSKTVDLKITPIAFSVGLGISVLFLILLIIPIVVVRRIRSKKR